MNVDTLLKFCELIDATKGEDHTDIMRAYDVAAIRDLIARPVYGLDAGDNLEQLFEAIQHIANFANECENIQKKYI